MERLCLDCGDAVKGRTDKKFCDDSCRNNYNNRIKSENGMVFNSINVILKKNRKLLSTFNPDGKVKVSKKKMLTAGFNFEYHTHTYQAKNGNKYVFCYEFGYLALSNEEFLLVKRAEKL
ncbi:hypothetical protein [Pedobacter sp. CFBP9032]|uniref:hypothetical protein n=1 Tax=Pedobacter sp. CFBP9032 TaxID=3096539 RepID=UPI002A6B18E9|nr:hypothetical protein [Pedobacter sp. CFBP9032]MDY0905714.1 hypothetical protein [Pedobacter sp. CFBP9032]